MLSDTGTPAIAAAVRIIAGLTRSDDFGKLVKTLQGEPEKLAAALRLGEDLERAQRRVLGVTVADENGPRTKPSPGWARARCAMPPASCKAKVPRPGRQSRDDAGVVRADTGPPA